MMHFVSGADTDIPLGLERLRASCGQNVRRGIRQRLVPFHRDHDPDRAALLHLEKHNRTEHARTHASVRIADGHSAETVACSTLQQTELAIGSVTHLVLLLVAADGGGVGHDDVVRRHVRLPVRVAAVAAAERRRAVVGRVHAQHVLELGRQVGLVERRPEPHPVAERREADVRVVLVLLPAYITYIRAFVSQVVVELVRTGTACRVSSGKEMWQELGEPGPAEDGECTGSQRPASQRIGPPPRAACRNDSE